MAVKFTASLDGVGHSELSNWLLSSTFSEQFGTALLGHLYFDTGPSNFFGGRGAVSIRDKRGEGFFSRLAPGEVGTTTTPPAESDRQLTINDGTAPIRFGGNVINARANWAKRLDVAQDIQLTGKATGSILGPLFQGDDTAVITVSALTIDGTPGGGDTVVLPLTHKSLFTGNVSNVAVGVVRSSILLNEWGTPNNFVKMGEVATGWQRIVNMADPIDPQDAVTKKYMLDNASGIQVRGAVDYATAAALAANTFTVATPSFIEANANGGPLQVDGVTVAVGKRILVKDEASKIRQGIYDVTVVGDGATKWKLTRSSDSDTTVELQPGMYYTVIGGTTNLGSSWVQTSPKPFTLDVQDCLFSLFSSSGGYLGGQGIVVTGKTIDFIQNTSYTQGQVPYAIYNGGTGVSDMAFSNVGLSGQPLLSTGGGAPAFGAMAVSQLTGVLPVPTGGTGLSSLTLYNVLLGNGVNPVAFAVPTTADYVLMSNGPTAYPTFRQITNAIVSGAVRKFVDVLPVGTPTKTVTHNFHTKNVSVFVCPAPNGLEVVMVNILVMDDDSVYISLKGNATTDLNITVLG